jgi:hypothetical protein
MPFADTLDTRACASPPLSLSLHGFSLDLQRLRAIMDKHRKGQTGR